LITPAPTPPICQASLQLGADIGTKINACEALLGANPGKIVVSGGGNIAVEAVYSHDLEFLPGGAYSCTVNSQFTGACFGPKSGTTTTCDNWSTTLQESSTANSWVIIGAYNNRLVNNDA